MKLVERPLIKRLLSVDCPLVAVWFPWYWRASEVDQLRKVAGRWVWNNASGWKAKSLLVLKVVVWPLIALAGLVVAWMLKSGDARRLSGRGRFVQLGEMLVLTFWRGFPPQEYFDHRFYMEKVSAVVDDFLSYTEVAILNMAINTGRDAELVNNKLRFGKKCRELGLPAIDTLKEYGGSDQQAEDGELEFPEADLYFKPVNGKQGKGIERWRYDEAGAVWRFGDRCHGAESLHAHFVESARKDVYILQEAALNHPCLEAFSKGGLVTFRVMTVLGLAEMPRVMAVYMVMPEGDAVANHGAYGGMVAPFDLETKTFKKAVKRLPVMHMHTHHPETGGLIEGAPLEGWQELEDLALHSHRCFPDIFAIGWDLALTPKGPQIVEGNTQWGSLAGFYAGKTGFSSRYVEVLKSNNP